MALQMQNDHQACIIKGTPHLFVMIFSVPITGKSMIKPMAPSKKPMTKVASAACLVPLRQKTLQTNTAVMGGARSARKDYNAFQEIPAGLKFYS